MMNSQLLFFLENLHTVIYYPIAFFKCYCPDVYTGSRVVYHASLVFANHENERLMSPIIWYYNSGDGVFYISYLGIRRHRGQ
jgi:hypothetical protein